VLVREVEPRGVPDTMALCLVLSEVCLVCALLSDSCLASLVPDITGSVLLVCLTMGGPDRGLVLPLPALVRGGVVLPLPALALDVVVAQESLYSAEWGRDFLVSVKVPCLCKLGLSRE